MAGRAVAASWSGGESSSKSSLLTIDEVPPWLRFNRFILTGYRPQGDVLDTALTFFQWHNESVNVWLHFVPALYFVWLLLNPWSDSWIMQLSLITVVGVFFASCVYHLFMPCCRSHAGYMRLILCDVVGALASITSTAYSFLLSGYRCAPGWQVQAGTVVFSMSATMCFLAIISSRMSVVQRFKLFGVHCVIRLLLAQWIMLPKVFASAGSNNWAWHTGSFFVILLGGMFNISRVPERWFPLSWRWIDFIGNSHNIWHVFCFLSSYGALMGVYYDDTEYMDTRCPWEL